MTRKVSGQLAFLPLYHLDVTHLRDTRAAQDRTSARPTPPAHPKSKRAHIPGLFIPRAVDGEQR